MQFITVLAGANFRPAETRDFLKSLSKGAQLRLERDPDNAYDVNAIKVIAPTTINVGTEDQPVLTDYEHFIGFVAKADNRDLAAILDHPDTEAALERGLVAEGHIPQVERCEIFDFANGPLKPTIIIEVSTGFELGTLVHGDENGDGIEGFMPEED